jgi:hypothetical protein
MLPAPFTLVGRAHKGLIRLTISSARAIEKKRVVKRDRTTILELLIRLYLELELSGCSGEELEMQ